MCHLNSSLLLFFLPCQYFHNFDKVCSAVLKLFRACNLTQYISSLVRSCQHLLFLLWMEENVFRRKWEHYFASDYGQLWFWDGILVEIMLNIGEIWWKLEEKFFYMKFWSENSHFQICLSWWFWFRWLVLVKLVGHLVNFTFREHLDFNENIICNCIWATFPFSCSSMADC